MTGRRLVGALVPLGFALAAFLFWESNVISPATQLAGFFQIDFYSLMYPMYHYGFAEILSGHIPLWNPYTFTGTPFLATLYSGILYPGNFLFLFLPTGLAMGMTAALHTFLAAWFMYLLGRAWGWSGIASGVAALTWAFSQNSVWFYGTLCFLASATWIPLMALGIERACAGRHRTGAGFLAFAGAMSLLAGGTQTFVYGAYALAIIAAVRLWRVGRERGVSAALVTGAWLAFAGVTAVALASPQILPTIELSSRTDRSLRGVSLRWADNPMEPAGSRASGAGEVQTGPAGGTPIADSLVGNSLRGMANLWTLRLRHLPALYFGVLPPLLAVAALFGRRWKIATALFLGGGVAFTLSLGLHTPLYALFHDLPTGNWFRNANRFVVLDSFAMAGLAGMGVMSLTSLSGTRRRALLAACAAACAGILLLLLLPGGGLHLPKTAAAAAIGLVLAGLATRKDSTGTRLAGVGLVLFLFGELWLAYANPFVHPEKNAAVLHSHAEITRYVRDHIGSQRTIVVDNPWGSWAIQRKYGLLNRVRTLNDFEPLTPVRYKLLFSLLENAPEEDAVPFDGSVLLDPRTSSKEILDMLAVRYVIVDNTFTPGWKVYAKDFGMRRIELADREIDLYENPDARPRAALVSTAVIARSPEEAASVIRDPAFDARSVAVIEIPEGSKAPPGPAVETGDGWRTGGSGMARNGGGDVRIVNDGPDRVVLEATVPPEAARWLVLMDLAFPGWSATLDGQPVELHPANLVGRAVALPPGSHRIVFSYDSRAFRTGYRLALAAALIWGLVAFFSLRGRNGKGVAARLRQVLPWFVTIGILYALFRRTGFGEVKEAARAADLPMLFGVTLLCMIPGYLLDVLSLSRVFTWFHRVIPFLDLARVKAAAYLIIIVNYNLGSGAIAFWLKRRHGIPFLEGAASLLFINLVDVTVLMALVAASLPFLHPPMDQPITALVVVSAVILAGHFLYWRAGVNFMFFGGLRTWPIFKSFRLATAGHYLRLAAIRLPFDLLFILNFWLALRAFDVKVPFLLALAFVPIILFVAVIPITVAGLGTVQAITLYLLKDYATEATILAFSLMLMFAMNVWRVLLALPFFRKLSAELIAGDRNSSH